MIEVQPGDIRMIIPDNLNHCYILFEVSPGLEISKGVIRE